MLGQCRTYQPAVFRFWCIKSSYIYKQLFFVLGLVKATLSVFSPIRIGQVGLGVLAKYTTLKEYYEKDINKITVIYNKDGYPIHPTK